MALWLARDRNENKYKVIVEREGFTVDSEGFNVVERISVTGVGGTWQQIPVCPNLVTLCAQYNLDIGDFSNLQFMTRLKVLDLSGNRRIKYLPIEIGMLINLESLNFSYLTLSRTLPIELKNLQHLRVFIMEHTDAEIPLEVFDGLKLLQVLSYYCSFGITKEKEEILLEKLESLPKLEELGANLETITGMHRLFNSKKLEGCLRKFYLYRVENVQLEMASLLGGWSTMKHLEIMILDNLNDIREVLCITPQIHTWHLDKLRELHIHNCNSITHLTWLRYAPLLESLNVYDCDSMEEVVKGDQDEDDYYLFSNLRSLVLDSVPKLTSIHKRSLPFPSLQSIHIIRCHELRKLPLNSNSAKDTLLVIRGYNKKWWNNLEWEDPAAKDLFHSKFVEDTM